MSSLARFAIPGLFAIGVAAIAQPWITFAGISKDVPELSETTESVAYISSSSVEIARLAARVLELEAVLESERADRAWTETDLRTRVLGLESELVHNVENRMAREAEWLGFTEVLATLAGGSLAPGELAQVLRGPLTADERAAQAEEDSVSPLEVAAVMQPAGRSRDAEVMSRLNALLIAEDVRGFELLETGNLGAGATGPVVLRMSDERGRPVGSLSAERMHLEASRAGRSVTIVLEEGYERRGGMRYPFEGEEGGKRRIHLPRVDPRPWIEALPELFRFEDGAEVVDDGQFNLALVQRAMNVLFDEDIAAGHYRLAGLGGVIDGVLRDVQLDELDDQERRVRSLIADRLELETLSRGVRIVLSDGVQVRGGRKVAFLDGHYRIFLPQVQEEVWVELGLPGLAAPNESPLARDSALSLPRRLMR